MQGPDDDARGGRPPAPDDQPYTVYGGRGGRKPKPPRPGAGGDRAPAAGRDATDPGHGEPGRRTPTADAPPDRDRPDDGPGYTVYDARRRPRERPTPGDDPDGPGRRLRRRPRGLPRSRPRRILKWVATAVATWILLSLVLFVVSATVHQEGGGADALLGGGGAPFTPTNLLILGTDERPPGSKEPGAEGSGGSARTDTLLLMRTGAFANAKLSIPRDTAVDVPDHGRQKINAAYAFDGVRGSVGAVENLTGVDVNHVATIDFENFPQLIDAMGGVRYTPKTCLTADVSGGAKRPRPGVTVGYDKFKGGTSFRLEQGETYTLEGSAALALARVRKNRCDGAQDDIDRAGRQQEVVGAMKRRILSPAGFLRLPMIAWKAPQAVKTDMSGFSLLGVALGQFLPGGGDSRVLKPTGVETIPGGGQALSVSPEAADRARRRFEK